MPLDLWPRLLLVRMYLTPWWLLARARRHPAPVIAVLAALVMIAGFGVAAVNAPVKGMECWNAWRECSWRVVVTPPLVAASQATCA